MATNMGSGAPLMHYIALNKVAQRIKLHYKCQNQETPNGQLRLPGGQFRNPHPSQYRHWDLDIDGEIATLTIHIKDDQPLFGWSVRELKLNSYVTKELMSS